MSCKRVMGPIFLQTIIIAEVYRNIIQQFIALFYEDECDVVFQQNNVRPQVVKDTTPFLVELFGE